MNYIKTDPRLIDGTIKFIDKKTRKPKKLSIPTEMFLIYLTSLFFEDKNPKHSISFECWKNFRGLKSIEEAKNEILLATKELNETILVDKDKEFEVFENTRIIYQEN